LDYREASRGSKISPGRATLSRGVKTGENGRKFNVAPFVHTGRSAFQTKNGKFSRLFAIVRPEAPQFHAIFAQPHRR